MWLQDAQCVRGQAAGVGGSRDRALQVPLFCWGPILRHCLFHMGTKPVSLVSPAMYPKDLIFSGQSRILRHSWRCVLGLGCTLTSFIHIQGHLGGFRVQKNIQPLGPPQFPLGPSLCI